MTGWPHDSHDWLPHLLRLRLSAASGPRSGSVLLQWRRADWDQVPTGGRGDEVRGVGSQSAVSHQSEVSASEVRLTRGVRCRWRWRQAFAGRDG